MTNVFDCLIGLCKARKSCSPRMHALPEQRAHETPHAFRTLFRRSRPYRSFHRLPPAHAQDKCWSIKRAIITAPGSPYARGGRRSAAPCPATWPQRGSDRGDRPGTIRPPPFGTRRVALDECMQGRGEHNRHGLARRAARYATRLSGPNLSGSPESQAFHSKADTPEVKRTASASRS